MSMLFFTLAFGNWPKAVTLFTFFVGKYDAKRASFGFQLCIKKNVIVHPQ